MGNLAHVVGLSFLSVLAGGFLGLLGALISNGFGIIPAWVLITSPALYALAFGIFPRPSVLHSMGLCLLGSLLVVIGPAMLGMLLAPGGLFDMPQQGMFSQPTGHAHFDEMARSIEAMMFFSAKYALLLGATGSVCMSIVCRRETKPQAEAQN